MLSRKVVISKVKSFIDELLLKGIPLDKVILYGSYAHGRPHKDSDIDIALVSKIFSGFGFEDRKFFSTINNKSDYISIETKTFSSTYFLQGDPFIEEINKTGLVLYDAL